MRYPIEFYLGIAGKDIFIANSCGIGKFNIKGVKIDIERNGQTSVLVYISDSRITEQDIIAFSKEDLLKQLSEETPK